MESINRSSASTRIVSSNVSTRLQQIKGLQKNVTKTFSYDRNHIANTADSKPQHLKVIIGIDSDKQAPKYERRTIIKTMFVLYSRMHLL